MTPEETAEVERLIADLRESRVLYVVIALVSVPLVLGFLALIAIFILPFVGGFSSMDRLDVYRFAGTIGLGITLLVGYLAWLGRPQRGAALRDTLV